MADRPTILLVDDTPENLRILSDVLSSIECDIAVANSGERALALIERIDPALILLDVMMPGIDGFETCQRLRALEKTRETPIIFVTALADDVARGFEAGGNDYISKPIRAEEVLVRVHHQLEKQALVDQLRDLNLSLEEKVRQRTADLTIANRQLRHEVNERRFMQDRLNYLARHDFVTQLYNRDALDQHVSNLLAELQHEQKPAQFIVIDIDQFRLINETCGCIAGDELLHQFAQQLTSATSASQDFCARLSGDKFAIVTQKPSRQGVDSLVRQLEQQIKTFTYRWENRNFDLEASITSLPISDSMTTFDQLLLVADEIAYATKKQGEHVRVIHDVNDLKNDERRSHLNWGLRIVDGLENGSFELFCQRVFPMRESAGKAPTTNKLEILVRLRDEENGGHLMPHDFIRAAERLGIVSKIDRWVISHTFAHFAAEARQLNAFDQISMNISALSARSQGFAEFILHELKHYNLPGNKFCFEITETEALNNFNDTRAFMQTLQSVGCQIALDDFGTGFSSFAYLMDLPFDYIKIDGMFVKDMDDNPVHQSMVASITKLAKLMNKPIIAEQIESQQTWDKLEQLDIEWGQGFHLHTPEKLTTS